MARLGDVCTVVSGTTPKTSNPDFWDGDLNWITPAELSEDTVVVCESKRKITLKGVQSCGLSPIPAGTVILSSRAPIGKTAIAGTEMYCNQGFKNLICSESIFNKYLFWFLRCNTEYLNSLGRGATFKEISKAIVEDIDIPLPDLPTQRRIAATLDKVSEGIALCKQMLVDLDELVKSQFVEMFGTFPANEHGWPVGTIREGVMDVRYGSSRKAAEGNNGQYPYLRMNNITYGGELDLTDVKTIDIPDDERDKCSVRRGDVLFNRTNSRELVGKTCVYNRDELMVLAGFVVRVRVNDRLLPEFLSAFMNTDFTKTLLLSMCKAAIGQANINATEFQNIGIYFPPIEHQQEFVQIKAQTDKSKFAVQQQLMELETLKKSLMQEYFG